MALTTVTRPSLTDDTGDGESGDVVNAAYFGTKIYDVIDALFSAAAGLACNGPVYERGRTAAIGEWIAFTPTLSGISLGNGTKSFKYCRIGKTILMEGRIVFGSTTTLAAAVTFSLPVANTVTSGAQLLGHAIYEDFSAGPTFFRGAVLVSTSTAAVLYRDSGATAMPAIDTTVPFTWAVNDEICVSLAYQEA